MEKFKPILVLGLFVSLSAGAKSLQPQHAVARFVAVAIPGNLQIQGTTPTENLQPTQLIYDHRKGEISGSVTVNLAQLDTGLALRNTHMKETYLKVGEYPQAVFAFPATKIAENGAEFTLSGTLTLCGKSLPVKALAIATESGEAIELRLSSEVKMSDYGMPIPQFMGVKVRDQVALAFEYRGSK